MSTADMTFGLISEKPKGTKYILTSEVYSTHNVVLRDFKPIKAFDSLTFARRYAYNRAPKKGWFILKKNERGTFIVGTIWKEEVVETVGRETIGTIRTHTVYADWDNGPKTIVQPDGTLGRRA